MRKRFEGFGSAVDLEQIDLVEIESAANEFLVIITIKSGAKITRRFPYPDANAAWAARDEAHACQKRVERWKRWWSYFAKVSPYVLTWLASAGFTAWLTGHLDKLLAWLMQI